MVGILRSRDFSRLVNERRSIHDYLRRVCCYSCATNYPAKVAVFFKDDSIIMVTVYSAVRIAII